MLEWTNDYSIGVAEFDLEHKELFKVADRLLVAVNNGQSRAVVFPLVRELYLHVVEHFASEEYFMQNIDYPYLEEHRQEHRQLTSAFSDIAVQFEGPRLHFRAVLALQDALCNWLVEHIKGLDLKMGCYVNTQMAA